MKKNFNISLPFRFQQVKAADSPVAPAIPMREATLSLWQTNEDHLLLQEFDGKYGYLYSYDTHVSDTQRIPLSISISDMHILYLMQSSGEVYLYTTAEELICSLAPQRARHLYLPVGDYKLEIPQGESQLFGLYYDGGIFRRNYELKFDFLKPLLHAQRQQMSEPVASIDFTVAERTHSYIKQLCDELTDIDLDNESTILSHLIALIKLSKEKVFDEYKIERADKKLAIKVHELLVQKVKHLGQEYNVNELARLMDRNADYLNKIHKMYYGCSLSELKEATLLVMAKKLLVTSPSISSCAYACGYSSVSAFTRFFQKQTGKTPSEYLNYTKKMR